MFPPRFDYHRAASVDEALDLLERHADDDPRLLAGGHALLPDLKNGRADPGRLVDIGGIESLGSIEVGDDDTVVGATVTYAEVADSDALWERTPAFAEAAAAVGDRQVRNRGTVGGNLARADPDADLPAGALAADATILARGPDDERTIDAAEFFRGPNATALADGELVTGVRLRNDAVAGGAYVRRTHPSTGYATVGVAAVVHVDDGRVTAARVAVTGVVERAVRLGTVEDALIGEEPDDSAITAAADRAPADLDSDAARSDEYVSDEYRLHLLSTTVEAALETAVDRAGRDAGGDRP